MQRKHSRKTVPFVQMTARVDARPGSQRQRLGRRLVIRRRAVLAAVRIGMVVGAPLVWLIAALDKLKGSEWSGKCSEKDWN